MNGIGRIRMAAVGLASVLALGTGVGAAGPADIAVDVVRPPGAYRVVTLRLERLVGRRTDGDVHIGFRDAGPAQAWVTFHPGEPAPRQGADATDVRWEGGRLTGRLLVRIGTVNRFLHLDVAVRDGKAEGAYRESWGKPRATVEVAGAIRPPSAAEKKAGIAMSLVDGYRTERGEAKTAAVLLDLAGGPAAPGSVHLSRFNRGGHTVDRSGLAVTADAARGTLRAVILPDAWVPSHGMETCCEYEIDAKLADGAVVGGTYRGRVSVERAHSGRAAGRVRSAEEIRQDNAVAKDKGWPAWPGPYGGLFGQEGGLELVEDPRRARLVWRSEARATGGGKVQPGWEHIAGCNEFPFGYGLKTGGATPIVAGGRVYLFYLDPTGDAYVKTRQELEAAAKAFEGNPTRRYLKRSWAIDADDVILCLDAATGQTLWTTIFRRNGVALHGRKGGPNLTPCVGEGKVSAIGSMGMVYCLDAAAGEPIWQTPLPVYRVLAGAKAKAIQSAGAGRAAGAARELNAAVTYADGVAALYDFSGGLLALDAKTGRTLWRMDGVLDTHHPVHWSHEGRSYLIGARKDELFCVEARTGRIVWRAAAAGEVGTYADAPSLLGHADFLLSRAAHGDKKLTCYRLSPRGPTKLWQRAYATFNLLSTTPLLDARWAYVPSDGPSAASAMTEVVELTTGRALPGQLEIPWGRLVFPVGGDGRLFQLVDWSHNLSDMQVLGVQDGKLRLLASRWVPPHPNGGSYSSVMLHPYVDGRLIMRGYNGIYCYDLRKPNPPPAPTEPAP